MHRCFYISEILSLIFEFVNLQPRHPSVFARKKTLACLARTCHLFSPPALDLLWHTLSSLDPLLKNFPLTASSVDDLQWATFHKYARRVHVLSADAGRIPAHIKEDFVSFLQHCPEAYLPLLPKITTLRWNERCSRIDILLLRYFVGPAVTTIALTLTFWPTGFPAELAAVTDLPKLCPDVSLFSLIIRSPNYEPSEEVGRMVTQWPGLRALRTPAITQAAMKELFSRRTFENLFLDCHMTLPHYSGHISKTVRELSLGASGASCIHFLQNVYAAPSELYLFVSTLDGRVEPDMEEMSHLLPSRIDTSRLLSLEIKPKSQMPFMSLQDPVELREPFISALAKFTALHELNLDCFCTAQMTDRDFVHLVASLPDLRSLKLGTEDQSHPRPRPMASVGVVIEILKHCKHLETLHIAFDGSILPPGYSTTRDGTVALSTSHGWGVSNARIMELRIGPSRIPNTTINIVASFLKCIMPCLVRIDRKFWNKYRRDWVSARNMLESY